MTTESQELFRDRYVHPAGPRTLVVGSKLYGTRQPWRSRFPQGVGVDLEPGEGVDIVWNLEENPLSSSDAPSEFFPAFDHIECCSVLEHTQRPWLVAQTLDNLVTKGSTIFLAVPWIWRYHAYPHDYWRFSHSTFPILFPNVMWHTIKYSHDGDMDRDSRSPKAPDGLLHRAEIFGFGTFV
jgi:hypothetical protein